MMASRTHPSVRVRDMAPWVRKMSEARRSGGSSRRLRNCTPVSAEEQRTRLRSSSLRHCSVNTPKSRGHFSLRLGGTMTTTGRLRSDSATDAATASATNVLPMPTSSASTRPGRSANRARIARAVVSCRAASSAEMRSMTWSRMPSWKGCQMLMVRWHSRLRDKRETPDRWGAIQRPATRGVRRSFRAVRL